jgi:hypothetical protein
LIDDKNMGKMREMTRDLTTAMFSDGWTVVNHHPIVNIIMGVRSLHTLRSSIDTMGQEKTMDFIVALISTLYCHSIIVTETLSVVVVGHRQSHCGQKVLGYHQGVCQGVTVCRQGLPLQ